MDRPKSILQLSPNFTPKDPGRMISCVIVHATATDNKESPLAWLCNPDSKVSAHYLIDQLGAIYHLVHEQNIAWHAGESVWDGLPNVNQYSVGIELVNANDGFMPYPEPQLQACADLCAAICLEHGISSKNVVGHDDIAPGRKDDPKAFPWEYFRGILESKGVTEA